MNTKTKTKPVPDQAYKPLLEESRQALAQAVFHAMQVAGEPRNDYPAKISQEAFADRAGISRSTLAKYLNPKNSGKSRINPDLETICKVSAALNVPPAFLLMTASDWTKLAQAVIHAAASTFDPEVKRIVDELARDRPGPAKRGKAGLRLAERLGVRQHERQPMSETQDVPAHWLEAQAQAKRQSQLGILSATSLSPIGDLNAEQRIVLLSLCALIGAATNLK